MRGGAAVARRVDHTIESEVEELFRDLDREHGRLDILINSIAGEEPMAGQWDAFWKVDLRDAEAVLRQCLLSHIVTAKHGVRRMLPRRRGLVVEVTEGDTLTAGGNLTYWERVMPELRLLYSATPSWLTRHWLGEAARLARCGTVLSRRTVPTAWWGSA